MLDVVVIDGVNKTAKTFVLTVPYISDIGKRNEEKREK